jgi:predicted metal-dependent hydrolase
VLPKPVPLPGSDLAVRVRVSPRARRLALKVDAQGETVELVLPRRVPLKEGLAFLDANRGWVRARLAVLPPRVAFADGVEVPVLGVPHRIRHMGDRTRGRGAAWIEDSALCVAGDPVHLPRRVRDHLKELARRELTQRARKLAAKIGCKVKRVAVRDTKSRWGSCSVAGNLTFSWRLVLAPEAVLHYLVAHEVAHLVEMNHGARFWALVERLAPGARHQRAWLRRNRARLLRFG